MSLPNQVTDSGPVDRNFRDLDDRVEQAVISTVETLKVVRGRIDTSGSGSILHGSGFSITRNAAGDVTVTFTVAFSAVPAVVAAGGILIAVGSGANISASSVRLVAAADTTLNFIAIGPR